jgi:2-polyprenyl-3-methyl-5-hydroxy-6-metoxy-1,4-benzoquinol methylase
MRTDDTSRATAAPGPQPSGSPGYYACVRRDIAALLPPRTSQVLEIGCASGGTMAWLRSQRAIARAVGVELVTQQAALARQVFDEVIEGSVEAALPSLAGRRFDLILALDVLEHVPDPWEVLRQLRTLQPAGGVLIASIPNVAHFSALFPLLIADRWDYQDAGVLDRTHLRFFTRRTARDLAARAGLEVAGERFAPAPLPLQSRLPALGRLAAPAARRRPELFALQIVLVLVPRGHAG